MASLDEQLKRIIAKKVKLANGKTTEQTLMEAVDYLYLCIQKRIDAMYANYDPVVYDRRPFTESLRSSLYAEDFLDARIIGNKIEVSLKFNNNVWAWNFNRTHKSNVALLMNNGWKWNNEPNPPIERFSHFEGEHFLEKGIADFNSTNRWGVKVKLNMDNSDWY